MDESRPGLPFIYGAQYYRAPTPEPECWEMDLRRMKEIGFNTVKFWVQWRWSHRGEGQFFFDDLDRLLDLAAKNDLEVTLNTIFDVAPIWLYKKYPDAQQITNGGRLVPSGESPSRQIGGWPGPCYNHAGALEERRRFLKAVVLHFQEHPAMGMWDVWNEPEQCSRFRKPDPSTWTCYCPHCRQAFLGWLQTKYGELERLNAVWGRCYGVWDEVELPESSATFASFIDFREFHLDTMTNEASWRLAMVKATDPNHTTYLHVVPNTMKIFNSVTGVDDFAMAADCDVFASTVLQGVMWPLLTASAGHGKRCYNVEAHIAYGSTASHQRISGLEELLADFLPQIGLGIRGFLFWQYRPEILGREAPAWGLVRPDGSNRPLTDSATFFWDALSPYIDSLLPAAAQEPEVGVWMSRKNELFHYAMFNTTDPLANSVEAYANALYWNSYSLRFIDGRMLEDGKLAGLKLLCMPSCYCVTEQEARALNDWVEKGGVLLSEAHLAGYNASTGRHGRIVPGCGLAQRWGIEEVESTSSQHLQDAVNLDSEDLSDDVRKAMESYGTAGGLYFPVQMKGGAILSGARRYAQIHAEGGETIGLAGGRPIIVKKKIGLGSVIYCGTNLGEGAVHDTLSFEQFMRWVCRQAGVEPTLLCGETSSGTVHVDALAGDGLRYLIMVNRSEHMETVVLNSTGEFRGIFSNQRLLLDGETELSLSPKLVDIFREIKS